MRFSPCSRFAVCAPPKGHVRRPRAAHGCKRITPFEPVRFPAALLRDLLSQCWHPGTHAAAAWPAHCAAGGRRIIRLLRRGWRVLREWQLYRQRLDRRKGARPARVVPPAGLTVPVSLPAAGCARAHARSRLACAADRATDLCCSWRHRASARARALASLQLQQASISKNIESFLLARLNAAA